MATIVVTSHGPRGVTDNAPANHYSTLSSIQQAFGLGCLQFTCDTANVQPYTPLFAIAGSPAIATEPLAQLSWPNFNSFYGAAASQGQAWAVGEYLNSKYQDRALIETWNGSQRSIASNPQPGSRRDMLFGASALSPSDVWVVGDEEGASGKFETLSEHWDGSSWTVIPTPDPGSNGNHLYAVDR